MLEILHIASEVFPFSKTGGLADVAYSLPKAQLALGAKTKVFTPLYKDIYNNFSLDKVIFNTNIQTQCGNFNFQVYKHLYNDLEFYFFRNDHFFFREGYYSEKGAEYGDNFLRFGCFCEAILQFLDFFELNPHIIHIHDWQASFIPTLIKTKYPFIKSKIFLTIHNITFQGIFDKYCLQMLNIPEYLYNIEFLEFYGAVNFLKGAIVFSDFITTVSPTYAKEITSPEFGYGLDGLLRKYQHKLKGILNGIDYEFYNPERDNFIYEKYNKENIYKKETNKNMLCNKLSLSNNKPLFIYISRFSEQKGIDLIVNMLETKDMSNFTIVILGSGSIDIEERLKAISSYKNNIYVYIGYNEPLAHKLYASADFLLMPSRFEPCGLSQLIAMRYGTIPIVSKRGGLIDTVKDIKEKGYGFFVDTLNAHSIYYNMERAYNLYCDKEHLYNIAYKCMSLDFSWRKHAAEYLRCYKLSIDYNGDSYEI
ncbi:MAG: glycogen/starch synthase [Deferribacterota bacterium]|nr:glycogen/starch synthase [Deferribacterota bacterium]